jgi:hypothetical protein
MPIHTQKEVSVTMVIINPAPLPPYGGVAYTNITPFTYRDGLTYLEVLESLRAYIRDILVPLVDVGFDNLEDYVDNAVSTLSAWVTENIENSNTWTAEQIAQLEAYVNEQVALIIEDSIQVQDPVMAGILNNPASQSRIKGDELWANKTTQTTVETGRLSNSALYSTFVAMPIMFGPGIDPTGVADSTVAMQAIIDANPNRTIFIPEGIFKISELVCSNGQSLKGVGRSTYRDRYTLFGDEDWMNNANFGGTVIRSTRITSGAAITIVDPAEVTEGGLSDLTLIGPGQGISTGVQIGSSAKSTVNAQITNIAIGNFSIGIEFDNVNEGDYRSLIIRGCVTGAILDVQVRHNTFVNLDVQWCINGMVINSGGVNNIFVGAIFQSNNALGIEVKGAKNIFYALYLEAMGTGGIKFTSTSNANLVDSPFTAGTDDKIIVDVGAKDNFLTNIGWQASATYIEDAGTRTRITGKIENLSGTGVDRIVIDSSLAGSPFGAWADFLTPVVMGGTGWALGDATVVAKYTRIGRTVHARYYITFGSTTTYGTASPTLTLPFAAQHKGQGNGGITRQGTGTYMVFPYINIGASVVTVASIGANGLRGLLTATAPATWQAGDVLEVYITYDAVG